MNVILSYWAFFKTKRKKGILFEDLLYFDYSPLGFLRARNTEVVEVGGDGVAVEFVSSDACCC